MKTTVTEFSFIHGFREYGRDDNFSREGLEALFAYFEELEADCGTQIDYDPIAICCEFSEYVTAEAAATEWGWSADDGDALSFLHHKGTVIEIPGTNRVIFGW